MTVVAAETAAEQRRNHNACLWRMMKIMWRKKLPRSKMAHKKFIAARGKHTINSRVLWLLILMVRRSSVCASALVNIWISHSHENENCSNSLFQLCNPKCTHISTTIQSISSATVRQEVVNWCHKEHQIQINFHVTHSIHWERFSHSGKCFLLSILSSWIW